MPLLLLHRAPLALLILTYPGGRARPVLAVIALAAPLAPEGAAVDRRGRSRSSRPRRRRGARARARCARAPHAPQRPSPASRSR